MTITEALKVSLRAPKDAPGYEIVLACGFTPLHLETLLLAHVQQSLPARLVSVKVGLFGNLVGTLESLDTSSAQAVAIAIEGSDLDPRLGFRGSGKWGPEIAADLVGGSRAMLQRIGDALERLSGTMRCVLSMPTLPFPPLFHTPGWHASETEMLLDQALAEFGARVSGFRGVAVVNARRLAEVSPPATRFDLKADLLRGLPYTLTHADSVAQSLAQLIAPPLPKKGLISDLDHTLWHGIVGEVGPEGVSWDLTDHSQLHGLYQRLLAALSEQGVLIGVASKNDPVVVAQAFERRDLLLTNKHVFPIEAHWNAKSGSVTRILRTWNIAADSVVFVDDSPLELAEVAAVHPQIECIQFPGGDYAAGLAMLRRLRDLCGKEQLSGEDSIRLESIRRGAEFQAAVDAGAASESFLKQVDARVTFEFSPLRGDARILELVNKTNQFNLNGIRFTQAEWMSRISRPGAITATVEYEDKFGPLGKIAVLQGSINEKGMAIDTWVMSCRAFARRIEYQCLRALFGRFGAERIFFDFSSTPRNGPLREFWALILGSAPDGAFELSRNRFEEMCPPLYNQVSGLENTETNG